MGDLTKNFSRWEFACPCCGQSKMSIDTVKRLQKVRNAFGKPIGIVEGGGYRCEAQEPRETSTHRLGMAVDLSYSKDDHFTLLDLLFSCGFTGIGDKNKDGRYQLHGDDAPAEPGVRVRPWKWTY